jgi:hypothetical protein
MELNRKPTPKEERLLELLVKNASTTFSNNWKDDLLVRPMDDGEMGSLYLFPNGQIIKDRVMGERVSEFQFLDEDGIEVIASLNVDDNGNLLELDIWKTDFSKLIKLPDIDTEQSPI